MQGIRRRGTCTPLGEPRTRRRRMGIGGKILLARVHCTAFFPFCKQKSEKSFWGLPLGLDPFERGPAAGEEGGG
jgi:hypothetical protein